MIHLGILVYYSCQICMHSFSSAFCWLTFVCYSSSYSNQHVLGTFSSNTNQNLIISQIQVFFPHLYREKKNQMWKYIDPGWKSSGGVRWKVKVALPLEWQGMKYIVAWDIAEILSIILCGLSVVMWRTISLWDGIHHSSIVSLRFFLCYFWWFYNLWSPIINQASRLWTWYHNSQYNKQRIKQLCSWQSILMRITAFHQGFLLKRLQSGQIIFIMLYGLAENHEIQLFPWKWNIWPSGLNFGKNRSFGVTYFFSFSLSSFFFFLNKQFQGLSEKKLSFFLKYIEVRRNYLD